MATPICSIEDGLGEDRSRRLAVADAPPRRAGPAGRRRIFVTQSRRILQEGIRHGVANASSSRSTRSALLTETLEAVELSQARGLTARDLRTARGRPRTRSSPISPSPSTPGDQRGLLSRGERTAEVQPASPHRGRAGGGRRCGRVRAVFRGARGQGGPHRADGPRAGDARRPDLRRCESLARAWRTMREVENSERRHRRAPRRDRRSCPRRSPSFAPIPTPSTRAPGRSWARQARASACSSCRRHPGGQ